jgi:hypothetical protein
VREDDQGIRPLDRSNQRDHRSLGLAHEKR